MEPMEGVIGSDEKGSENDESLHGSNGKKRRSPGAEKDHSTSAGSDSKGHDGEKAGPKKWKKVREEVADLHAETQRLLRETPGTSFAPEEATKKPVSSLIEKIRQRKLQLSQSATKSSTSTLGSSLKVSTQYLKDFKDEDAISVDGGEQDDLIEFVMSKPPIRLVVKQAPGLPSTSAIPRDEANQNPMPVDDTDEAERGSSQPSTPDIQFDGSSSNSGCKSPSPSALRAPVLESQDLYSDSQLSIFKEDDEDNTPIVGNRLNLHLDSETQDDDRWLEEDEEKENRDPISLSPPEPIPTVANVRGLVDDEAEDEDEDDDDPLEDEVDEAQETAREMQDLLTQDSGEKPVDIERRAELHSKWLEQQDLAMEGNILNRIESGWKNRGKEFPALLCETQEKASKVADMGRPFRGICRLSESAPFNIVSSLEILKQVKDDVGLLRGATTSPSIDQATVDPVQPDDYRESSDDEEAEENLRRQLFLQESEEKTEFLSVANDESSREIFSLINKVNVATIKSRTSSVHTDARASAAGYHRPPSLQHQSSFLQRKATSTAATTRQGSGSSRSYVFGRDDSNSRDASRLDNKQQIGNAKAKASDEQKINSTSQSTQKVASSGSKRNLPMETKTRGPSLFQVLKQQAAELASGKTLDLNVSSTRGDNLSIFMAIKPRQPRGSRGT